jgi:hypothetical protein
MDPERLAEPGSGSDTDARDAEELANFGYQQELRRDWGLMHNFGISFSIIVSDNPNVSSSQALTLVVVVECYYRHYNIVQLWT